jgi:hypothetical protein
MEKSFEVSTKRKSRDKIGAEFSVINKEGINAIGEKIGRLCKCHIDDIDTTSVSNDSWNGIQ